MSGLSAQERATPAGVGSLREVVRHGLKQPNGTPAKKPPAATGCGAAPTAKLVRRPKAVSARRTRGIECPAPRTAISRPAMKGEGPTVTRTGELSQFYHVAIAADKVQGHRDYDAMYGFAEASSMAQRTF
jgi:hypothetical protein